MSAKEMFEKLGYTYQESYFNQELDEIKYSKDEKWTPQIHFSLNNKCISVYREDENERKPSWFTVDLLEAINKQIEELGWLNE